MAKLVLSSKEEELLWRAMETESELRELVAAQPNGFEKIRAIRVWLREYLPQVRELPFKETPDLQPTPELKIAKAIVELLRK